MTPDFTKDDLTGWIASGKENEAMDALLKIAKYQSREIQSLIFLTSNKYRKLRQQLALGSISRDNAGVLSSEINQNLLNIIDQIRLEEITEKEVQKQLAREKRKQTAWPLLLSLAGILVLVLVMLFMQDRLGHEETVQMPENQLVQWRGNWEQVVEIGPGKEVGGPLTFEVHEQEIKGIAQPTYANGVMTKNRLYNIVFTQNGKVLKGKWKYEEVLNGPEGNFEFTLSKDQQSFTGTYYSVDNPNAIFKWSGRRK